MSIFLLVVRRPAGPAASLLYWFLIANAWWALFLFAEGSFQQPTTKQLFAYMLVPGWVALPTLFLLFSLHFSGLHVTNGRLTRLLLLGEPFLITVLILSNPLHRLVWEFEEFQPFRSPWLSVDASPVFYIHLVYSGALILIGSYTLMMLAGRMHRMRWRMTFIPLAIVSIIIGGTISFIAISVHEGWHGISALLFGIGSICLARSLLDNMGMEISQVAEVEIYRGSSDGLVLVNDRGLIVQMNPAFERITQKTAQELVGKPISELIPEAQLSEGLGESVHEITRISEAHRAVYDLSISPIHDHRNRFFGWSLTLVDVTRHRQAEEAARMSEERYRALFEQASDAILLIDSNGNVADANHQAVDLFGFEHDRMIGMSVNELHPAVEPGQAASLEPYRTTARRSDDTVLYIEVSSAPLITNDAAMALEIIRDATDRILAEGAEQAARQINLDLRKTAADPNTSLDVNRVLGNILERMREIVPYDASNVFVIQQNEAVSIHARGYERYGREIANRAQDLRFNLDATPTLAQVVRRRRIVTIYDTDEAQEWRRGVLVDDVRSWIGAPIILDNEVYAIFSLVSGLPGAFTARNTERVRIFANQASIALENARLYDEAKRRVRELKLLTQFNRELVDETEIEPLMLQVYEHLSQIFDISDVMVHLCALHTEPAITYHVVSGSLHTTRHTIHQTTHQTTHQTEDDTFLAKTIAASGKSRLFASRSEVTQAYRALEQKITDLIPESGMGVPLPAADQMIGALLVQDYRRAASFNQHDLELLTAIGSTLAVAVQNARLHEGTRQRAAQLEDASTRTKHALEAAENANHAKTRFLATMSHEIRTPLNGILGMTDMLLESEMDRDQRAIIEIVRTSAETLSALINDILDLSKIESGRLELEHHPFNLRECLENAMDMQVPRAMEKGLDLAYFLEPGTPENVVGDIARLRQVLVNLLSNGLKFTDRGGVFLRAWAEPAGSETASPADACKLHFTVSDTGIGIPADKMGALFQNFSQLDPSTARKYGGTGLGLAISKQLCELMGGTAWAESQGVEGLGTTFHFTILVDVERGDGVDLSAPPELCKKKAVMASTGPFTRSILARYAEIWGIEALIGATSEACIELIDRGPRPDFVLLDDLLELEQKIRNRNEDLPILLLATPQSRGEEAYLNGKVQTIVYKPVKPARLRDALVSLFTGETAQAAPVNVTQAMLDANMAEQYPLRILLAEDNIVNQKVAMLMLGRLGYKADLATNGLEAVEMVKEKVNSGRGAYDIVLMDVHMPVMNGEEATLRLREELAVQYQPYIVALTADALETNRERFLASGMDAYISKPIHIEDLMNALVGYRPSVVSVNLPVVTPVAEDDPSPINQETIDRWMKVMGSGSIFAGIIGIYLGDASSLVHEMELALKAKDWKKLYQSAHTLKSSSANFGALKLADQLAQIERATVGGMPSLSMTDLQSLLKQVRSMYPDVSQHLRNLQNELLANEPLPGTGPLKLKSPPPTEGELTDRQRKPGTAPLKNLE